MSYDGLKSKVLLVFPWVRNRWVQKRIRFLLYLFKYRGSKYACPVCGAKLRDFITMFENDKLCPNCGSLSRKRALLSYLLKNHLISSDSVWLHFTPSLGLYNYLKTKVDKYYPTDYQTNAYPYNFDITNLELPDNHLNYIICYHILEHIPDDIKAMNELFRVLRPGGRLFAQVPFGAETDEDPSVTDPAERKKRFGQEDHVRVYKFEDFLNRLASVGFICTPIYAKDNITSEQQKFWGISQTDVFLSCQKPLSVNSPNHNT